MKSRLLCTALALAALAGCSKRPVAGKLDGQVFVTANSAETFKLALVPVALYPEQLVRAHVDQRIQQAKELGPEFLKLAGTKEAEAAAAEHESEVVRKRRFDGNKEDFYDQRFMTASEELMHAARKLRDQKEKAEAWVEYLGSGRYLLGDLSKPIAETKTDADGHFSFEVPQGHYVVVAFSRRMVPGGAEFYSWAVAVNVAASTQVRLANDNLTTTNARETVLSNAADDSAIAFVGEEKDVRLAIEQLREPVKVVDIPEARPPVAKAVPETSAPAVSERDLEEVYTPSNLADAQREATRRFPELSVAGSDLNKRFLEKVEEYKRQRPDFFQSIDWPIKLAREVAAK